MPTVRVLTINARKSNIEEIKAERHWDRRWPYMRRLLNSTRPVIIGGQEWTVDQCVDHSEAYPNWTFAGGVKWGNCPVFWDTKIMRAEDNTVFEKRYPSGHRERYGTLIRLTHIESGAGLWVGAIHLAANGADEPNSPKLRTTQMAAIVADFTEWIAQHPHPEDGKPNLAVCGDLNDNLGDHHGVRKVALAHGWKPLRTRVPLDKFSGDTYRSFNGWGATSRLPRDSKAIDEIFTSGVDVEDAALRRTCRDVFTLCATDHNIYSADVVIGSAKPIT